MAGCSGGLLETKSLKVNSESSVERRDEEQGGLTAGGGSVRENNCSAVQLEVLG